MNCCGWIFVFSALALVTLAKNCFEECGGEKLDDKAFYEGSQICYYRADVGPQMMTKCAFDCLGEKPAADQTECFCDLCKRSNNYMDFCMQPENNQSITSAECATKVCAGNGGAKFRGRFCIVVDEEEIKHIMA